MAGTLILLIPVLILTVVCVYKMLTSHCESQQSDKSNEEQLQSDVVNQTTLFDLKANEAYGTTVDCDVENEDSVDYDEITIKYDEATPHIATDNNVAYGQAIPHITTEDNVAYSQISGNRHVNNPIDSENYYY